VKNNVIFTKPLYVYKVKGGFIDFISIRDANQLCKTLTQLGVTKNNIADYLTRKRLNIHFKN